MANLYDNLQNNFLDFLEEEEERKTTSGIPRFSSTGDIPNRPSLRELRETTGATPTAPKDQGAAFALYEMVGQGLWGLADEGTFGLLGIADKKYDLDVLGRMGLEEQTQTGLGTFGRGVGTFAGYAFGGPMKLGTKLMSGIGRVALKAAGKKSVNRMVKDGIVDLGEKSLNKSTKKFIKTDLKNAITDVSSRARWSEKVAKNFGEHAEKNIINSIDDAVKRKVISADDGVRIAEKFKNLTLQDRPMQDIIDLVMSKPGWRMGKEGFALGSIINEGITFGMIDSAMEWSHSYKQDRDYDIFAPLWGLGVGSGFGLLKLMNPAGKAAPTKETFMDGLKAVFSRQSPFRNMNKDKIVDYMKWLGDDMATAGEATTIKYKGKVVNLLNPESSLEGMTPDAGRQFLASVMDKQRHKYGKEMMKWALKEDFASSAANWKRMVAGTAIMNARSILAIGQGQEIPSDEIITSVILGAYFNRRGIPKTPDMDMKNMVRLRKRLHITGQTPTRMYDAFPTLHDGRFELVNPLNDPAFKKIVEKFEEMGLASDVEAEVNAFNGGKDDISVSVSQKDFQAFDEVFNWVQGATGKRYLKPKSMITEKEALTIENMLKDMEVDGVRLNSPKALRKVFRASVDKFNDVLEDSVVGTMTDIINNNTNYRVTEGASHVGQIPKIVQISQKLKNSAEAGHLEVTKGKKGQEALDVISEIENSLTHIFQTSEYLGRASFKKEGSKQTVLNITEGHQLVEMLAKIRRLESNVNNNLSVFRPELKFTASDLPDISFSMAVNSFNKGMTSMTRIFDASNVETYDKLKPLLYEAGFLTVDGKLIESGKQLSIKGVGETVPGKYIDIKNSLLRILGAKGQHKIDQGVQTETTIGAMDNLLNFLNTNGVNTRADFLRNFTGDIVNKVYKDNIKDTKINSRHLALLNELMNYGDLPFAKLVSPSAEGVGWVINKVDLIGAKNVFDKKNITNFNKIIDEILDAGTKSNGAKIINEGNIVKLTSSGELKQLAEIAQRVGTENGQRAYDEVIDIIRTLEPNNVTRMGLIAFLKRHPNQSDTLTSMLLSNGVIKSDQVGSVITYKWDKNALFKKEASVKTWLDRMGFEMNDLQKMLSQSEKDIDTLLNQSYDGHKGFSQHRFFSDYLPSKDGFGSSIADAEGQNNFIKDRIYWPDTGKRRSNAVDNVIKDLTTVGEIKGRNIAGSELVMNKTKKGYGYLYDKVAADVQKIIFQRNNSMNVKVLNFVGGSKGMSESVEVTQKTHFIRFLEDNGIPFVLVSGDMTLKEQTFGKFGRQTMNIFEMDSAASGADQNKLQQRKKIFNDALRLYRLTADKDADPTAQDHTDFEIVQMGNAKNAIAIPKSMHDVVKTLFKEKIYDPNIKNLTGSSRITMENQMKRLNRSDVWGVGHGDALRQIIIAEMWSGKGYNPVPELMAMGSSGMANIAKRFSLWDAHSARTLDAQLGLNLAKTVASSKDSDLLNDFSNRKIRSAVWNDGDHGSIAARETVQKTLKKLGHTWKSLLGDRKDPGGYDSITWISKDFKRYLELMTGHGNEDITAFKPIIAGGSKDDIFVLGKTVFVYHKDMQHMFDNTKLDMLTTDSAIKSENTTKTFEVTNLEGKFPLINKSPDDVLKMDEASMQPYVRELPLSSIGIVSVKKPGSLAKQSASLFQWANNAEAGAIFDNLILSNLDKNMDKLEQLHNDPISRRLALMRLKGMPFDAKIGDFDSGVEGRENVSYHMKWLALDEFAIPEALGDNVILNTLKSNLIDPTISPTSKTDTGVQYGAKSVLTQSLSIRDLDPSVKPVQKGDNTVYRGEILLPKEIGEIKVDFNDTNFEMNFVNKNGEVVNLEGLGKKLLKVKGFTEQDVDVFKDWLSEGRLTLSQINDHLKAFAPDWDIGILTTRYPRTKPNDLAVLRLKGFLDKDNGNNAMVNDFDVLNIFEGDYDVDTIDYFWGMDKGTWDHVNRTKQHWVSTVNTDNFNPTVPEMKFMSSDPVSNTGAWNKFDANNRVFKKGIGIVQKTIALVNHLSELGVKVQDGSRKGMSDLIEYTNDRGQNVKIAIDFDNTDWFIRTALESQMIIDYWKGVDTGIVNDMVNWRNDYLFNPMETSRTKEEINQNTVGFNQSRKTSDGSEGRIRIFRKYVDGQEVVDGRPQEITGLEKSILQTLMSKHSRFLRLNTEVYDGSGEGKKPGYHDMISESKVYFHGHMQNLDRSIFLSLRRKFKGDADFEAMFGVRERRRKWVSDEMMMKAKEEKKTDMVYDWYTEGKSPFAEGVVNKGSNRFKGKEGSVIERTYQRILMKDPLDPERDKYDSNMIKEGKLFDEAEYWSATMLSRNEVSMERMREILPRMTKDLRTNINLIRHYKRTIAQLANSNSLPSATIKKRIKGINKIIAEKESAIMPALSKKYLKSKKAKDLPQGIKLVDITKDRDVKEGAIQYWTIWQLMENFGPKGGKGKFFDQVQEAKDLTKEAYSQYYSGDTAQPWKNMTILNDKQKQILSGTHENIGDVEAAIEARLEAGFNNHGMSFLFHYGAPNLDQMKLGVYNGRPLPVASFPTGRFKRMLRFMLKKHSELPNGSEKSELLSALKNISQRYSSYHNFFNNNHRYLPNENSDIWNTLNATPGYGKKIVSLMDKYDGRPINKNELFESPFGMGRGYDGVLGFYRGLTEGAPGSKELFGDGNKQPGHMSYMHQIVMENEYMNPVAYLSMLDMVRTDITNFGLDQTLVKGFGPELSGPINPFKEHPLYGALAGNGKGVSLNPLKLMSNYKLRLMKDMSRMSREIKESIGQENSLRQDMDNDVKAGWCVEPYGDV